MEGHGVMAGSNVPPVFTFPAARAPNCDSLRFLFVCFA